MPRRILAAAAALALAAVWSPPAYADSTVTVRTLPDSSGTNPQFGFWNCSGALDTSNPPQTAFSVTDHDPAPETGDASWGFYFFQANAAIGPSADVASSADLATLQLRVSGVGAGKALVFARPDGVPTTEAWVGTAAVSGPGTGNQSWTTVSAPPSTTFSWQLYDISQPLWSPVGAAELRTVPGFDAAHGTSSDYFAGFVFGCDLGPDQKYHFDDFQIGASGAVTTYNFDKVRQTIPMGTAPAPITAGGSATIRSTSQFTDLVLQQRPYGSSAWSTVRSVAAVNGTFSAKVAPLKQTSYRWETPAASCCLESFSPAVTVKVHTAVTIRLADSTIRKGQSLVASGVTKPHKPGVAVSLWRKTATGASLLASSKVHSDGTYRISYRVPSKGTWKVFVKVAAASGNLAGQSAVRSATVS
ncbi:MAG TPA: hypothetical protein VN088_12150 [Nocardioides sp.]|nr:hypothetical protein [Nocardioides sp.]